MNNRKIIYQVTRQYMKQNKKRTLTTFFGIMFMVLLMTCVFVGKDTAISYLQDLAASQQGKWHVAAYGVTQQQYEEIAALEHVKQVAPSATYGCTVFEQSENELRPYLQVKAYTNPCFDWMNVKLVEGNLPKEDHEIVISYEAIKDGANIKIGDEIQAECFSRRLVKLDEESKETIFPYFGLVLTNEEPLDVPENFPYFEENESFEEEKIYSGFTQTYKVVGFIQSPNYESSDAAGYTAITLLDDTQPLPETFNISLMLDLKTEGSFYDSMYDKLHDILGEETDMETNDTVLAFSADSADSTINGMVMAMSVFFVLLIMAASVILIYNVFNISFDERSRYLGMLSSVGATGRQKRISVYYEAFLHLLFALPAGFLAGCGVVKLGMAALEPYMDKIMGGFMIGGLDVVSLQISLKDMLMTGGLCAVTVAISAILPARKIGKVGPIECIRGNVTRKQKSYDTNLAGLKTFGIEGMLAGNMLNRQKKKARSLIGAISIFMMILIVTGFSTTTLSQMITHILVNDQAAA